jgi:glycogen debranching enzyme
VLALDGRKRRVVALASNIGHLLWTGIADERRADATASQLLSPRLFSGWGIRSLAAGERAYDPFGYHVGCVWPHDSAIAAAGLRRYGYDAEAARVCLAIVEAADRFGGTLPEVFAGLPRDDAETPVEYAGALRPQAWASGAPLHVLRSCSASSRRARASGRRRSRSSSWGAYGCAASSSAAARSTSAEASAQR